MLGAAAALLVPATAKGTVTLLLSHDPAIESSLAFLGLSNDNVPTLGTMIYWALKHQALLAGRWWWLAPPIVCIILTFVGFFLMANALVDRHKPATGAVR